MTDANLRQYDWLSNFKGLKSKESDKISSQKKKEAWEKFNKAFPRADLSKFTVEVVFYSKTKVEATVYFKAGDGLQQSVFGSNRKFWSNEMKKALGILSSGGFPEELQEVTIPSLPVPALDYEENPPSLKKIYSGVTKIFVKPSIYFTANFRDIFDKTTLKHVTAKESKEWLSGPKMRYWPQQLNFAVWCATVGCGVSRDIFDKNVSSLSMPDNVYGFYQFHVYFTIRRILFEMGGISSISSLPGDPNFDNLNNKYDVASYNRICKEFGIPKGTDFRHTHGVNKGLGNVYPTPPVGTDRTPVKGGDETKYPSPYGGWKFKDEGGTESKGDIIALIKEDKYSPNQFDWFCPNYAEGFTRAGLARVNQSIEAFVYCVLGAQVNVRSSILGRGGRAMEAQREFMVLVEDAIRQPDLSKSVQRYQLAVDQAKVRLNMVVCPGAWLMPGDMEINTESTIGYNNQLKQATKGMKLGINNEVNTSTKKAALQLMDGGKSKINPPNSHPSNPIHKAATAESKKDLEPAVTKEPTQTVHTEEPVPMAGSGSESHDLNKVAVAIGAVAVAGLAFGAFR